MSDPREVLNYAGSIIALLLVALLGFSLYALFYFDARPTNHDILLMVITFLTAKIGTVIDFFFSSSAGSRTQQDTIAKMANTAAAVTPPPDSTVTTTTTTAPAVDPTPLGDFKPKP